MSRGRFLLLATASICIASLLAIAVCEASLQVRYRLMTGGWIWQDLRSYSVRYGIPVNDRRQYALQPNYRYGDVSINELGYRGELIPRGTRLAVAVVGDSVPFGSGVADNETYPKMLDDYSKAKFGRVLNGGVPSYNLRQSFDRFRYDVEKDYGLPEILIVHAANDVSLFERYGNSYNADLTWASERFSLPDDSRILLLRQANALLSRFSPAKLQPGAIEDLRKAVRNALDDGIDHAERKGIVAVLLTINPFYYEGAKASNNDRLSLWGKYGELVDRWGALITIVNEEIRAAARRHQKTKLVDVQRLMNKVDKEAMFIDFIHHSPSGNRWVADLLQRELCGIGTFRC